MVSKRTIRIDEKEVEYTVRRYRRAKNLRLTVNCDASVVLTTPCFVRVRDAESFIRRKADWILEKIAQFKHHGGQMHWCCKGAPEHFLCHKERARELVEKKLAQFNAIYNYSFKRISIKNQKSRWGSCSRNGNLNFNYKLVFLDERLADYVVVHELCHLRELNHSAGFWKLVAQTIPDFWERRKELMAKRF